MGNHVYIDADLVFKDSFRSHHLLKDVFADDSVDGRERVVKHVDVLVLVNGTGQGHALLLTPGQVDALGETSNTVSYRYKLTRTRAASDPRTD